MKITSPLFSLLLSFCSSALTGAEQLPALPAAAVGNPSTWVWHYFAAPDLPDRLPDMSKPIGNSLQLPDGRTVPGRRFQFPENGIIDLYTILSPRPAVLARTILTADFTAPKAGILTLAVGVDWKVAARCNGQLFLDTRATGSSEIPTGFDYIAAVPCRAGRNQIVLEAFGGAASFDVALKVLDSQTLELRYAPWTAYPDADSGSISIIFATNYPSPAGVEFRRKGSTEWRRRYDNLGGQIRRDRKVHAIRLSGLEPDSEYEYRVVLLDPRSRFAERIEEIVHTFRSAPRSNRAFSFLATADVQVPARPRAEFLTGLLTAPDAGKIDFFAFLGDIMWTSDCDKTVIEEFVMPFRKATGNRLPLVMVRGNHEIYGKDSNRYFQYFSMPEPGREGYGMFRYGEVCFIVLDFCDNTPRQPFPSPRVLHDIEPYLAAEEAWLKKAVELPMCRDAKYRIVLAHGMPVGDLSEYMPGHVRRMIDPLFAGADPKVKVHLYLSGHVHRPFRSIPGENACCSALPPEKISKTQKFPPVGVNYHFPVVITGGPSKSLPDNLRLTSIKVDVTPEALTVSSRDRNGKEFDRIAIAPDGSVTELAREPFFRRYDY